MSAAPLARRIDALLPQTQCTQCGYAACMPYAEAIAHGGADLNRCPPGGAETIRALAALLGREAKALDPACGVEQVRRVALIEEARCIGCTLCIQACPVDAIVGAAKCMHTVIADWCTGCGLCVPPCPVDCIDMLPLPQHAAPWSGAMAAAARARYDSRNQRLAQERSEPAGLRAPGTHQHSTPSLPQDKRALIRAVMERAKARRVAAAAKPGARAP